MKKLSLIPLCFLLMCITAAAQHISTNAVPEAAKTSFEKLYPGVKASWEKEGKNFEAGFKKNGETMSVLFNSDGILSETEKDIKQSKLPKPVQAELDKRYKGKEIKECAMITKASGEINYEAEINGKDVLFLPDGTFLKEVKD